MSDSDPRVAAGGYLDHLTVEKGASVHTLSAYRRDLARYCRFLDAAGVDDLRLVGEEHVEAFRTHLAAGDPDEGLRPLSPGSVARTLAAVRGLHRFATRDGLVPGDAASAVTPPKPPRRLPKALPVDTVVRILEAAGSTETDTDPSRLRDRAMLELLYATGARASELLGLDLDDVDGLMPGSDGATVLLRGKRGKERLVPVGGPAREAVSAYLVRGRPAQSSGRSPALFLNSRGGRLSRQSLWAVVARSAASAGVDTDVSPHTFRHSFATHLLDGGADLRVVQELLGHSSVTTTQIYTLVTVETLREVWAECHPRAR